MRAEYARARASETCIHREYYNTFLINFVGGVEEEAKYPGGKGAWILYSIRIYCGMDDTCVDLGGGGGGVGDDVRCESTAPPRAHNFFFFLLLLHSMEVRL